MIDPVAAALVVIYFIAMVGIGIWASKKIQNMSDYVVAGRSLDFWVFTMLMIGSVCSGMSLLGVSGLGYKFAWPTIWEQLAVPLSIAFCIIFFGVKMHTVAKKSGYMTVQDYLAHRFESQTSLQGHECDRRNCRIDDLSCRTVYRDKYRSDVAVRASPLAGTPYRSGNRYDLYGSSEDSMQSPGQPLSRDSF